MPGAHGLDSIIFGFYKEHDLINVARVRNRFAWGGPVRCQGKGFLTLPIVDYSPPTKFVLTGGSTQAQADGLTTLRKIRSISPFSNKSWRLYTSASHR